MLLHIPKEAFPRYKTLLRRKNSPPVPPSVPFASIRVFPSSFLGEKLLDTNMESRYNLFVPRVGKT